MKKRALFSTVLLLCAPMFAQVKIAWAHGAIAQNPEAQNVSYVAGAPNGLTVPVSDNAFLYVGNFNHFKKSRTTPTPYTGLGQLLGLSDQAINGYDIIAFEGNDNLTKGGGWESSVWFVTDAVHGAAGSMSSDEGNPKDHSCPNTTPSSPLKFLSGSITRKEFVDYFKLEPSKIPRPTDYTSWILIDVPDGIDVSSDNFRLWVTGALTGTNRDPDPDAFGVIRHDK